MVLPLIVLDISDKVREDANGIIPQNSFVALRTNWSKRWPGIDRIRNWDAEGKSYSPGWSMEVLDYLERERMLRQLVTKPWTQTRGTLRQLGSTRLKLIFWPRINIR